MEAQDYKKLIEALRFCARWHMADDALANAEQAADAIEALNRLVDLNTERCEGLREQLRKAQEQYEKHLNELAKHLPKRGKWKCSYPEIEPNPMFMYGICSICGFEQSISDKLNYCPNCGAKMEVQERAN